MGFLNIQTFEFTPSKHFCDSTFCEFPFFYIRPKNRLNFYTPCQVLVINLDKTSSMAKFSWSFVRWAMLQTVNWVILPNGMMQNTLQLTMPQVCHITCSAILPALTLWVVFRLVFEVRAFKQHTPYFWPVFKLQNLTGMAPSEDLLFWWKQNFKLICKPLCFICDMPQFIIKTSQETSKYHQKTVDLFTGTRVRKYTRKGVLPHAVIH